MHGLLVIFLCPFLLDDCLARFFILSYCFFWHSGLSQQSLLLSPLNVSSQKIQVKYPGCMPGLAAISTPPRFVPAEIFLKEFHPNK
jgi:hypothetical protein